MHAIGNSAFDCSCTVQIKHLPGGMSERHRLPASPPHAPSQPFGANVHVVDAPASSTEEQKQQEEHGEQAAELEAEVSQRLAGQRPEDGALIIYTSGTTGRPKGGQPALLVRVSIVHFLVLLPQCTMQPP